ncbi:MAG: sugar phosphate isomerase/epimerase family protein [Phycisphaerales bacterium JB038]
MIEQASRREFLRSTAVAVAAGAAADSAWAQPQATSAGASFAPPIGVCGGLDRAPGLAAAGGSYMEVGVQWFLAPHKPAEVYEKNRQALEACPLPAKAANGFIPGSLKSTGPEADHSAVLAYADLAFQRAKEVGIEVIVFGSSGSRTPPKDFDLDVAELQFVALLGKMGMLAEKHDVLVALEPLNKRETHFINTVEEGARLIRAVQHPNIWLLADIFHMLREDEPAQSLLDAGDLLKHVHIAEKAKRTAPGVDGDDFTDYLQALKDIGYGGRISMECGWKDFNAQIPTAVATLQEQLQNLA